MSVLTNDISLYGMCSLSVLTTLYIMAENMTSLSKKESAVIIKWMFFEVRICVKPEGCAESGLQQFC